MKPRKTAYLAHRWIGIVISLQLLAWSVGGFVFSILDIESVRGETDSRMVEYAPLSAETLESLPEPVRGAVRGVVAELGETGVARVGLVDRGLGAFWEVRDADSGLIARVSPLGHVAGRLSEEEAQRIATADFVHNAPVSSTRLIESDAPMEYRGRPLPVYRVELGHAKRPHIYVDALTGQITARRNRSWRTFDFLWMLHTMDYNGRDNFNHWLLTAASLLAIATAGTGLTLWGWRVLPKRKRGA
jgi:hypothetical protein